MAEEQKVQIPRVQLGTQGFEVSKLGFGCMGLTGIYNDPVPEELGISIIKHAFDKGITFFDTSDVYGPHINEVLVPHINEVLVGKALKQFPRDKVQLATKFGIVKIEPNQMLVNGSPEYVRSCCEASLKRLGVDYIDLYYQHRIDTTVPIEDTMEELKKLVNEGKIKYIGLSEASPDTIRRAHAVHPITAIQMEWSLWTRDIEEEIVPLCRELGIGIVPYSPLGRGFFGGKGVVESLPANNFLVSSSENYKLARYSDNDWAGNSDDRKNTTGFVFFMGDTAFTWMSKKQPIVTLSTCEAEYVAATSCVCHAIWLRNLLKELSMPQEKPTKIYVDNKSAIALAKNPVFDDRSKHIDTRYHYIRECIARKDVQVEYVKSQDQIAEIFTKPLKQSFIELDTQGGEN